MKKVLKVLKNIGVIIALIVSVLIIFVTAFLPIILSIATGNWLWMFLYAIMWSAIGIELFILSGLWFTTIAIFE